MWAREGKIDEIEIPSHDVFIESIDLIEEKQITGKKLLEKITKDISLIKGDFRQNEILHLWNENLKNKKEEKYSIIKLRISCGSGVYVRGIANDVGLSLEIPSLALSIVRTKVGDFEIN
jgi:tRNA U55 pseudouridine synthase TruB